MLDLGGGAQEASVTRRRPTVSHPPGTTNSGNSPGTSPRVSVTTAVIGERSDRGPPVIDSTGRAVVSNTVAGGAGGGGGDGLHNSSESSPSDITASDGASEDSSIHNSK